jgi:hypothetical protein
MKKLLAVLMIVLFFSSCLKPERKSSQDYDIYYWRSSLEDLQISPNTFEVIPYIFETIPLNAFSFNIRDIVIGKNVTSETIIIILGWSIDGKILLLVKDVHWETYMVIDLVNASDFDDGVGGNILYTTQFRRPLVNLSSKPFEAKKMVLDIARQYNIESVIDEIGAFPYHGVDNYVYDIIMLPEKRYNEHPELARELLAIETNIYRTHRPDRKKTFTYLGGVYSLKGWYIDNTVFLYAKSPFENRIAIIGIIPYGNVELEPIPYQTGFYGIDLNKEF